MIQSRSILPTDVSYPTNALHIWAENTPLDDYNKKIVNKLPGSVIILKRQVSNKCKKQDIDKVLAKTQSETGGLDYEILVKEGAGVVLTTNISIPGILIDGQMGLAAINRKAPAADWSTNYSLRDVNNIIADRMYGNQK